MHSKKLKSIPLKYFLSEWLKVRNLVALEESEFSEDIKKQLKELKFLHKEGGFFFGDLREVKIYLVLAKEKVFLSKNQIQDYLEELKNFINNCGRKEKDIQFITLPNFQPRKTQENLKPLFFIVAKSEKPLSEIFLGGENKKNINHLIHHTKIVKEALDSFYTQYYTSNGEIPNLFIKRIYKNNIQNKIHRFYFKKFIEDKRYVLLFLSLPKENFDTNYIKNIIDFYVYSERPVLKFQETIKDQNWNCNLSLILIEIRFDLYWKGIFYNSNSLFIRKNKNKVYFLPEYNKSKKYIPLSSSSKEDYWILFPNKADGIDKESFLHLDLYDISKKIDFDTLYILSYKNLNSNVFQYKNREILNLDSQ
ncbi:MAG: hypothetical protein ACK4UJ_01205 [Leptonema sp. (in: bacteria)]